MTHKKAGRRPLDPTDPSVDVYFRLPSKQYAELCKRATKDRCSVPEHLRRLITGRRYLTQ
jgi:hypothetical protein